MLAHAFAAAACCCTIAQAADPRLPNTVNAGSISPGSRIDSGNYVIAKEAFKAATSLDRLLLLDVRTRGETIFGGVATAMHRHIPYVQIDDDHAFDSKNGRYKLVPNPDFVKAVDSVLAERKLDRKATLILYCSVGERSAKAANLLAASGFTNVYSMVDGFEGDPASKLGPGWKASGLPWSLQMSSQQAYKSPSM